MYIYITRERERYRRTDSLRVHNDRATYARLYCSLKHKPPDVSYLWRLSGVVLARLWCRFWRQVAVMWRPNIFSCAASF